MDQYRGGRGADRQFFLSCWSGEPAKIDRKSAPEAPLIISNPHLCILGGVQPGKLSQICGDRSEDDGFADRILFSFPAPVSERRWSFEGLSETAQERWSQTVAALFALEMRSTESGDLIPVTVELISEARLVWAEWYDDHCAESEADEFPEYLVGPWSKLISYAGRLALIIQLLRKVCGETNSEDVDAESLRLAIRLIDYFKAHARIIYRRIRRSPQSDKCIKAWNWILGHGGECHPSKLTKNNVGGVESKSEAMELMKAMEDRGLGVCDRRQTPNHRNVLYFTAHRRRREAGQNGSNRPGDPNNREAQPDS